MKKFSLAAILVLILPFVCLAQDVHKGAVLATFKVDSYTYMEIDESGKKVWIASPLIDVKVGDTVETSAGTLMTEFHSKALNKTFAEIYFVTYANVLTGSKGEKPKTAHPPVSSPATPAAPVKIKDIPKPKGAHNLKEIFAGKEKLKNKSVVIVAQVTKSTSGIMGKNWLHVTDNSGKDKPLDLTVTTKDTASVGDLVKITGKLSVDKDFGAGYLFPVIIEDAKITPYKE